MSIHQKGTITMTQKQWNCLLYFADQLHVGPYLHRVTIRSCVKHGWLERNPYFGDHLDAEKHGWDHNTLYRLTAEGYVLLTSSSHLAETSNQWC